MQDKGYSKYQYSIFEKGAVDGQYVVRTDNLKEFEHLVEYVKSRVTKVAPQTTVTTPPTGPDLSIDGDKGQGGKCPVHGDLLVWKTGTYKTDRLEAPTHKAGEVYGFWACPTKNADGSYCTAATKRK